MQGFKKTLVALLAVTMVLSLVGTAFAAIPEDVAGTKYEDAAVRLMALGVFKGDDKGNFNPDAQITRAEAVAIIIRALGLEQSSELMKGVTKFADVNADPGLQWATGVINIAVSAGIVDGYPNGQFGGRDPVKYEELAKMILYALNYGITVEGGVWPTAVLAKADDLEMLKGISVVAGAPIVRGLAAKMLDNSLDINSLKQTGYGDLKQFEETGATMLEKMGYDEVEGRVVAIPEVENALDDDEVVIEVTKVNGEALKDSKEETYAELESVDVQGLFGLKVRAWVNDDDEVVFVQKKTADKDIYNDTVSKNYEKGNKLELVVLDDDVTFADDATIYVNYKKAKLSELKEGYFGRFVQDKNKVVFANVFNFSTNEGVVTKVDDKRISYFKFDDTERILNLTKADSITVFNPDLTKADFEDIEKDSVIAWWKSSDDYYIVLVNEKVEGELTKVQSGKVFLDGKGYNMKQNQASYSLNEDDDIKEWLGVPGDLDDLADEEAVALLNLKGHVRHLRGAVDVVSGTQYGIVTTSTSDSKITVFTKDGEEVTYDLDKRSDWGVLRDAPAGTYYYGSGTDLGYYILSYKVKADESIAESDSPVGVKYAVSVKGAKPESGGISFKLHANAKADWGKVGKAEKGDRFIKLDNNDAKKYYIDSKTIIMRAIKSTTKLELDPTLVKWDDFKDLVLENDPENMAVVFGEAGKDAKAIIFVHADFAGVTDDTYYGVISDTPGKKGGDWYAEIDTFEEGVVDYKLAKSGSDLKKGDLVEFEINFKGEADLKTVATTTKEVKGVDGNYRLLNSDWYRIEDGVVVYEWNQVDKKLGDKAVLSDIQKGDSIKFFDKADKVIKVAILYKGEVVDEDDDVGEGVVTYIVTGYNDTFGRFTLEDRAGEKVTMFVEDFDGFELGGVEVSEAVMEAWLAEAAEAEELPPTIKVTEDNVLVVEADLGDSVELEDGTVAVFSQDQLEIALDEAEVIELYGEFKGFEVSRDVTIKGGTIDVRGDYEADKPGVYIDSDATVVIDGVTFTGTVFRGIVTESGKNIDLTVKNCTFKDIYNGIYLNPGVTGTIEGNTFINIEWAAIGINSDGSITISGNNISNAPVGVEIFGENVTVSDDNVYNNVETPVDNKSE